MALITQAFDSLDSYIAFFSLEALPVLKHTAKELQAMREHEDSINGRTVAALVLGDPMMTLKVLIHIEAKRRARQNHDITTIERAVMMMGISPFLHEFSDVPTIENQIADHPKALIGVLKVISRARRAARYARDWAILRHDLDVDEITVAALLSEVTEILRRAPHGGCVVCTLKDAVKLGAMWPRASVPLWYVSQRLTLDWGEPAYDAAIRQVLDARSHAPTIR